MLRESHLQEIVRKAQEEEAKVGRVTSRGNRSNVPPYSQIFPPRILNNHMMS